jgi:hypothetical protein
MYILSKGHISHTYRLVAGPAKTQDAGVYVWIVK